MFAIILTEVPQFTLKASLSNYLRSDDIVMIDLLAVL